MKKLIVVLMAGLILAFSVMCVSAAPASNGESGIKEPASAQRSRRMQRRYHNRMQRRHHNWSRRHHTRHMGRRNNRRVRNR